MHENVPKQILTKQWLHPYFENHLVFCEIYRTTSIEMPIIFAEISYHKDYKWVRSYETILNLPFWEICSKLTLIME